MKALVCKEAQRRTHHFCRISGGVLVSGCEPGVQGWYCHRGMSARSIAGILQGILQVCQAVVQQAVLSPLEL